MASHPIDDFLSELDNIYRHYDAFKPRFRARCRGWLGRRNGFQRE